MTGAHNKALHQTGRGGAAGFLRRQPVVEARPAGEGRCTGPVLAAPAQRGKVKVATLMKQVGRATISAFVSRKESLAPQEPLRHEPRDLASSVGCALAQSEGALSNKGLHQTGRSTDVCVLREE